MLTAVGFTAAMASPEELWLGGGKRCTRGLPQHFQKLCRKGACPALADLAGLRERALEPAAVGRYQKCRSFLMFRLNFKEHLIGNHSAISVYSPCILLHSLEGPR